MGFDDEVTMDELLLLLYSNVLPYILKVFLMLCFDEHSRLIRRLGD